MSKNDFDEELRFCSACDGYVRYLLSPQAAYCARCGGRVRVFSPPDMQRFRRSIRLRVKDEGGAVAVTAEPVDAPEP